MLMTTKAMHFPCDLSIRRRYFCAEAFSHPAKLNLGLLQWLIDHYTNPGDTLLDPMAGTGSLMLAATQQRNVILRDIQPEYVDLMLKSVPIIHRQAGLFGGLIDIDCADSKTLVCPPFNHIITSPPYGFTSGAGVSNPERIAKLYQGPLGDRWRRYQQNPNDACYQAGFRYAGGQANTGNKSGRNYWRDMQHIYRRCADMLPSGGRLILILKNHYRRGKLVDVVGQTITTCESFNLRLTARHGRYIDNPSLWQRRRREQGLAIIDIEDALVFEAVR